VPFPRWDRAELSAVALVTAFTIFAMRGALLQGATTYEHDNLYWGLPLFHRFVDGVLSGYLPLWNPYSHGGETLLTAYFQLRLLDPVSYLTVLAGSLFTSDATTLFNWDRWVRVTLGGLGTHLLLRGAAATPQVRVLLVPVAFLSAIATNSYHQNALPDQFYCAPYAAFFFLRILGERDYRWRNWIGAAIFTGISFQSYFYTGTLLMFLSMLAGFALFRREALRALGSRQALGRAAACLPILAAMALPMLVYWQSYLGDLFLLARYLPPGWENFPPRRGPYDHILAIEPDAVMSAFLPYAELRHTGTFLHVLDFLTLWGGKRFFHGAGEAYLFIGVLPFCLALAGIAIGCHPLKPVWLTFLAALVLLGLGPQGGLHNLIYQLVPVVAAVRHTHGLSNFIMLGLAFFYVLGLNALLAPRAAGEALIQGDRPVEAKSDRSLLGRSVGSTSLLVGACAAAIGAAIYVPTLPGPDYFSVLLAVIAVTLGLVAMTPWRNLPAPVARLGNLRPWETVLTVIVSAVGIGALLRAEAIHWNVWLQPLLLASLTIVLLLLRRRTSAPRFWGAFGVAALLAGWFFTNRPLLFPVYTMLFAAVLPIALKWGRAPSASRTAKWWAVPLLLGAIYGNLMVEYAWIRYWSVPRPEASRDEAPRAPFPGERQAMLPIPEGYRKMTQVIRYREVMQRWAVAFDPLRTYPADRRELAGFGLSDVRREGVWNSFAVSRRYARLVYSHLDPRVVEKAFAIGEPPVQFRAEAAFGADFVDAMAARDPVDVLHWLDKAVFLRGDPARETRRRALPARGAASARFDYQVNEWTGDALALTVRAPSAGYLIFVDGFDPFWSATRNGTVTEVLLANGNFKAVRVPAGESEIRFQYSATPVRLAFGAFEAAFLAGLLVLGVAQLRDRRSPPRA
jgi:hypothetical protein